MRVLLFVAAAVLLPGCATTQQPATSNTSPSSTDQPSAASKNQAETGNSVKPAQTSKASSAESAERPVDFTFLGITPDKQNVAYRIKVNTTQPIEEVHFALKEMEGSGKVLEDTTLIWQNIVKSTRQTIESGKSYEDQTALLPGATKAECSLKEVVFKDGTRWTRK